ncbi:hypothetical protein CR513_02550, partial [Mucuna pruriens]
MEKATPSIPRPAPQINFIKQDNSGKVCILWTNSKLEGVNNTSQIPHPIYKDMDYDQKSNQSPTYSSMDVDETLRKDFRSKENKLKRDWFFQNYKGKEKIKIQDEYYGFIEKTKTQVPFFDWFHAYSIKKKINYPWQVDVIINPSVRGINWVIKDGKIVQSDLPPETLVKPNIEEPSTSSSQIEKPLFKPFKMSDRAQKVLKEFRKQKFEKCAENSEILEKINNLIKAIPEQSEGVRTRSSRINVLGKDSDNSSISSFSRTEEGSVSEREFNKKGKIPLNLNPVNWKSSSKLYYQRPTAPDLLLEERGEGNFRFPKIFPEQIQQGFAQFTKLYNFEESRIPTDLKHFSSFALAWIFSWQYRYSKTENNKHFPILQRHFFVKWWNQFDASKEEPDKVKIWFKSNPEFLKPTDLDTSLFLNQKSQLAAFLARSKSKKHLTNNLKEVLKMLHSQEEAESSSKTEEVNSPATTSSDISFCSSSSTSLTSYSKTLNLLIEQDNQTHEVTPKHNIFDKEVRFEKIN